MPGDRAVVAAQPSAPPAGQRLNFSKPLVLHRGSLDLVVAADSLPYLGDLSSVFHAAHALLRPGGCFALTADLGISIAGETDDQSPPDATADDDAPPSSGAANGAANGGGGADSGGGGASPGASVHLGAVVAPQAELQFTGRFALPRAYLERLAASVGLHGRRPARVWGPHVVRPAEGVVQPLLQRRVRH